MRKLRAILAGASVAAFTCGVSAPVSVALDGHPWQISESGIKLTRVYSDWRSDYDPVHHRMGPIYFIDCAEFTNQGTKNVSNVQVMFALASVGEAQETPALPYDTHAPTATGKSATACRAHAYENGYKSQHLVGWVNAVTYADGSRWHAAPPVTGSLHNLASMPVTLKKPVIYLPLEECDDLTNTSNKTISHVQIVFHHSGIDGTDLGDDALDVKAKIAPGETLKNSCRNFNGYGEPDLFYYARALSHGESNRQLPRIFVRGKESVLSATVTVVHFADGTSWDNEIP